MTKAACLMARQLELQSQILAEEGMSLPARDACREVRQLRLLAALDG